MSVFSLLTDVKEGETLSNNTGHVSESEEHKQEEADKALNANNTGKTYTQFQYLSIHYILINCVSAVTVLIIMVPVPPIKI